MANLTVPAFHGNINFNAQHAPMGAFFSFTCGHFGTPGGFGLQIGQPGNQDLFIGVKDGDRKADSTLRCLPFFKGAVVDEAARYDVERAAGPSEQNVKPKIIAYAKDQIRRHYGWATDRWATEDVEFTIFTPFGEIPDPTNTGAGMISGDLLPAVVAELTVDNTRSTRTKTGFFAIRFPDRGTRLIDTGIEHGRLAFAWRHDMGVAGEMEDQAEQDDVSSDRDPFLFMRWTPNDGLRLPPHHLGSCPGIGFEVAPGERRTLRLALGVYLAGIVTTRLEGRYWYTRTFSNLTHVLDEALWRHDALKSNAQMLDEALLDSGVSPDQQFLIAHSTRSYYGSTQLLDVGGQPFWVVNEGEYCMMNTLDLSVDQVFWELEHNPWVVKNLLDNFARYYSYQDEVKERSQRSEDRIQKTRPGGIAFCHDMGVHNNFSPFGQSSYELPDLDAICFSFMTGEQLCNWVLIAGCYLHATEDLAWARQNRPILDACLQSLINRGPETGIIQFDAARCRSGAEITTYDSLDHSLAQTRNNVYMAVKCWASYHALRRIYEALGDAADQLSRIKTMTGKIEQAIAQQVQEDGHLPAVFEEDNSGYQSRILPAIEGLMYPLYLEQDLAERSRPFYDLLKRHTLALLTDPQKRNLFPDGGIRLSSTSNNSWMSKIAIFQHVARAVFGLDSDPAIQELFVKADAAHVKWQTEGASAYWAMSDQMVNGVAIGSKYYPRCVTTALWLTENQT